MKDTKRLVTAGILAVALLGGTACGQNAQQLSQSGDRYLAKKEYKDAIIEYRRALQQEPKLGMTRYHLAQAYAAVGDTAHAYGEYIRAADLLPNDRQAQLKAAEYLVLSRQYADAKTRADAVLAKDPKSVNAQILKANALAGLKDIDGAVKEIQQAIAIAPARADVYADLGALELARGQKAEAERAYKKAVTMDPKSVEARLALANFEWAAGRKDEAEAALKDALRLEPDNVRANRALAAFYIATKQADKAEPYLKTVARVAKTPASKMALASYYRFVNRPKDATRILEALRTDKQVGETATIQLALIAFQQHDRTQAYALLDGVLKKDSSNAVALDVKARMLAADGRFVEAETAARAAVAAAPANAGLQTLLGQILEARHQPDAAVKAYQNALSMNPHATLAELALARLQLARGHVALVIQLTQEVLKRQPTNDAARLLLARAFMAKRDFADAETELQPLVRRHPESAVVQEQWGVLKLSRGDRPAARQAFEKALQIDANATGALGGLVALDLADKRPEAARALVEARLAKTPDQPGLLVLAARTYLMTGKPQKAEQALTHVIEIAPQTIQAYALLAQLYTAQNRLNDAKRELIELTRRQPDSVGAQTILGLILQMQGQTADARIRYQRALAINPQAAVAANNLAWLEAQAGGNLDVALQNAQTAKAQLPNSAAVNDTLGWIYYKKGWTDQAIRAFEETVAQDRANPTFEYHLGLAYAQAGEVAKARAAIEAALASKKPFSEAADARKVLAGLKKPSGSRR